MTRSSFPRPLTESSIRHGMSFAAGLRVYDISHGRNRVRSRYADQGTRTAASNLVCPAAATLTSRRIRRFTTRILRHRRDDDPTKPHVVGRWWLPGMWQAGGETPQWPKGRRYALHHAIVAGTTPMAPGSTAGLPFSTSPTLPSRDYWRIAFGIRRSAQRRTRPLQSRTETSSSSPMSRPQDNCADGIKRIWVFDCARAE